jgi:hyperosmotically inducible periplasmic protein
VQLPHGTLNLNSKISGEIMNTKNTLLAAIAAVMVYGSSQYALANPKHEPSATAYWADFKQDSKQTWKDTRSAFRDGWIEGKLATAIAVNRHLNPFEIGVSVDDDTAKLTGTVDTKIERELAGNIALGVEGIDKVDNSIQVKADQPRRVIADADRSFSQYFSDVSTTATIKTNLLKSPNVSGLDINVDTFKDVVTLNGKVETSVQKSLAEAIAKKVNSVDKVVNHLVISS